MQKIIKVLCSSALMVIFISSFARGEYVSGTVVADGQSGTWTKGNSPYIATGTIYVNGTLTIEPGVEVRFKTATAMNINGILIAEGTPDGTITFTSNQNPKNKGDWEGIVFNMTSKPSKLTYCQIEYGGGGSGNGNIYCNLCVQLPVIASCTISNSDNAGIYSIINTFTHPILYLQHCLIRDNDGYPVLTGPMLDMKDNTIINNGVKDSRRNVICIWGVLYTGINEDITWHNQGIPYLITENDLLIGDSVSPGTLTIDAGVTIKVDKNRAIIIGDVSSARSGCLQANGTDGGRITFTSNQIPVNPGDWGYIKFTGYSQNSYLKYCKIEYGGNDSNGPTPAIWCDSSAPEISNTDISNVYSHGVTIINNGSPTITWTTIRAGTATYDNVEPSCIYSDSSCPQIGSSSLMKSKYGIYAKTMGILSPNITNSNIIGNTCYGIYNDTSLGVGTITATNNWWGHPSGPTPEGTSTIYGDKVSDYVEYSPWIGSDTVSPDQITLELREIELGTVTLQWLPTGDDFDIGTPTYYVINYATTPITNNNWGNVFGSETLSPDTLTVDGKYYYYSVGNLSPKTLYYFGIKAVDDAGNWSDLSNCVGATTKAILETPRIYNVINGNTWVKFTIQNNDFNHQVGFWVYYGSRTGVSSENYDDKQDAGIVAESGSSTSSYSTETTISNLDNGKLYYFVAYAYDPASSTNKSKWSDKSNEVTRSPTALSFAAITGSSNVLAGGSVTYTGQGYGSFGEELGSLTYSWWCEPELLGTITPTNTSTVTFSAGTKTMRGTLTVEARDGTISV
ncbi:MAG: fibronectin type III domain-containing protein, partial [bacterium]